MTRPDIWLAAGLAAAVAGLVLMFGWVPLVVAGFVVASLAAVFVDW